MSARTLTVVALAVASAGLAVPATLQAGSHAGHPPTRCRAERWCTITASGESTPQATQFAIGNVRAGTVLAITQYDVRHRQVGGEIIGGVLAGSCAWSQYQRDWSPLVVASSLHCTDPVRLTSGYVAGNGTQIWSGCYPRCFSGVPMRLDRRCGTDGHVFCYRRDCLEYANFFPWTPAAHPANRLRRTGHHALDVRYLARYPDSRSGSPFYMVRDAAIGHGVGDWVFISARACGVVPGPTGAYHRIPRNP